MRTTFKVTVEVGVEGEDIKYSSRPRPIYEQLEDALGVVLEPVPDGWYRKYNLDFRISVCGCYIGLELVPLVCSPAAQSTGMYESQRRVSESFKAKYGGEIFSVSVVVEGKNKVIHNPEVIEEIRREIERLRGMK